jgi:hypothetical protein
MAYRSNQKDTSKTTMLVISMGFLVIYLVFSWDWAVWVSLGAGITGIVSLWLSQKVEWLWMKLAKVLSFIVPNILLSLVFFLILFPLALLSKLFNKDPLMLSPKYKSYFIEINREMEKSSFGKTW